MKLGLKLVVAAFPVPASFWVFKSKEPWWVKIIVGIWTAFIALLLLGILVGEQSSEMDDLTGYLTIAFIASFLTGCVHAIKWAILKDKEVKADIDTYADKSASPAPSYKPLTDSKLATLYKLALQVLDDDKVDLDEAKSLRSWFKRHPESENDYRTQELFALVNEVLADQALDKEESLEVFTVLSEFCDEYEEDQQVSIKQVARKPKVQDTVSGTALNNLPVEREYYMEYVDAKGKVSKRNIILHDVENKNGIGYLYGYCLLRGGSRTFKADNVQMLCDVETGEVLV